MKFSNPTPLQLGMTGSFLGKAYRIVGRVVMGCEDGGTIYYWQEYNLVADDGTAVTLVYEPTESGAAWRLFTLFEPRQPLSADECRRKRVGHRLNLDGVEVTIDLVDQSTVYHIEGEAPEGVERGDVADYINATAGKTMQVVSWTGEEVECYRGLTLRRAIIMKAFSLPLTAEPDEERAQYLQGGSSSTNFGPVVFGAIFLIAGVVLFANIFGGRSPRRPAVPSKTLAGAAPLSIDRNGTLNGMPYHLQSHSVVEIAGPRGVFDRHEYRLLGTNAQTAILVCGLIPGVKDWHLFTPLAFENPLSPLMAGTLRVGDTVQMNGPQGTVTELQRATVQFAESTDWLARPAPGTVLYSFTAQTNWLYLLARWDASRVNFYQGQLVPADQVKEIFAEKK